MYEQTTGGSGVPYVTTDNNGFLNFGLVGMEMVYQLMIHMPIQQIQHFKLKYLVHQYYLEHSQRSAFISTAENFYSDMSTLHLPSR